MSAQGIPLKADFRERARVNDIPVARLIGFEAKEIADSALRSCWQPDGSMQIPWDAARRNPLGYCRCGNGDGVCKHACGGGILHLSQL